MIVRRGLVGSGLVVSVDFAVHEELDVAVGLSMRASTPLKRISTASKRAFISPQVGNSRIHLARSPPISERTTR